MRNSKKENLFSTIERTNRSRSTFILLLLIAAILFLVSFIWPFMFSFRLGIITQQSRFDNAQFDKISVSGITDGKGTITFFDSELNLIYPEDSATTITQEELDTMLRVEMTYQTVESFTYTEADTVYTMIYSEGTKPETSWFVVIDENSKYIESNNFHFIKDTYTDKEIVNIKTKYVTSAMNYKYEFVSNDGKEYIMIVNLDSEIVLFETYEIIILASLTIIIITLFIVLLRIPSRRLSKKLKQPIKDLAEAMDHFVPGESVFIEKEYDVFEYDSIITTFNKMVAHINNLEEENKELLQNRKDMFAAIAHDLKTPITVLNGYVNAIINGKVKSSEIDKYYDLILAKTALLTSLINEFALFNQMNHSSFKLKTGPVNITEHIRNYFASHYQLIDESGFTLSVDIEEAPVILDIDSYQFEKVLDNILNNFLKYNPIGTDIHIQTNTHSNLIDVILENNGTKINEDIATTMFDPFVIDDKSRTTTSTGLGLSITKRIIELHGGAIFYSSTEKYVNRFTITLHK